MFILALRFGGGKVPPNRPPSAENDHFVRKPSKSRLNVNFGRIVLEAQTIFLTNSFLLKSFRSETFISDVFRWSLRRIVSVGSVYYQLAKIQPSQRHGLHVDCSTRTSWISGRDFSKTIFCDKKNKKKKFYTKINPRWKAQICNLSFQLHRRKKLGHFEAAAYIRHRE